MNIRWILLAFVFCLLYTNPVVAAEEKVLFDAKSGDSLLELFSESEIEVSQTNGKAVFTSLGDFYLVYPEEFRNADFNQLFLNFKTNQTVSITALANISSSADYSFELEKTISPSDELDEYTLPLNHELFEKVNDWALKIAPVNTLNPDKPLEVTIEKIYLKKSSKLVDFAKDFWQVAPYTPATVNVLPTPAVFGRAGFYYFLPIFIVLVCLLIFSKKYRIYSFIGLFALWMVFDLRMTYEFAVYAKKDKQSLAVMNLEEKTLRSYGDFYGFVEWSQNNIPESVNKVHFVYPDHAHYSRIMSYFLYPVNLDEASSVYLVYKRPDILESVTGEIISKFDEGSFILKTQ